MNRVVKTLVLPLLAATLPSCDKQQVKPEPEIAPEIPAQEEKISVPEQEENPVKDSEKDPKPKKPSKPGRERPVYSELMYANFNTPDTDKFG